jgi:hypothetical protein
MNVNDHLFSIFDVKIEALDSILSSYILKVRLVSLYSKQIYEKKVESS